MHSHFEQYREELASALAALNISVLTDLIEVECRQADEDVHQHADRLSMGDTSHGTAPLLSRPDGSKKTSKV